MQEVNHYQINLQQVINVIVDLLVESRVEPLLD